MNNKVFLLALNRISRVGPRTVFKLQKRWPELGKMFALSCEELEKAGLPTWLAHAIASFSMKPVEDDLKWELEPAHHLITIEDSRYPALLKEIYDPPVVLYAAGDLTALKLPSIGVVGTRKPSMAGSENAFRFAKALALKNISIVSGLAAGIDARAHEGCLEAKGRTIAVMGTGCDRIYPAGHRHLAEKIMEKGLLLSEFPLKSAASAGHFPRRNRIISGLSLSILVVEAAIKSGSLITARLALEQNRDVLAIPGSIHNPQARGCHHLLQQGAKLVTCVEDILGEANIKAISEIPRIEEPTEHIAWMDYIGDEVVSVDQIIHYSGMDIETVICRLSQLELQGVIRALPGGYARSFQR